MKKPAISIGIIGLGTVGTGVVKILLNKKKEIERKLGFSPVIARIADIDIKRKTQLDPYLKANILPDDIFVTNGMALIENPSIDIIVELIGGILPAKEYIIKALKKGKHVVTANKALLASKGLDIFRTAYENNVEIGFEAAVAGGIPIIKIIREALIGNRIKEIYGIINGTSNYILTQMTGEGIDFSAALKEAQTLGYAEADPTLDVEGVDAAHKLAILASLSFGIPVPLNSIYTEGITKIAPLDINFARELGYKIKLLAIAKETNKEVELRVHPTMLPEGHLISNVNSVFNAVYLEGDAIGPALYYGKGAGEMPTGSAVVSDIVDIARDIKSGSINGIQGICFTEKAGLRIRKMDDVESCYYFRFSVLDRPGVLSKISGILGSRNISIKSVIQKVRKKERAVPLVMMTHKAREKDVIYALKEINKLKVVSGKTVYIRVERGEE